MCQSKTTPVAMGRERVPGRRRRQRKCHGSRAQNLDLLPEQVRNQLAVAQFHKEELHRALQTNQADDTVLDVLLRNHLHAEAILRDSLGRLSNLLDSNSGTPPTSTPTTISLMQALGQQDDGTAAGAGAPSLGDRHRCVISLDAVLQVHAQPELLSEYNCSDGFVIMPQMQMPELPSGDRRCPLPLGGVPCDDPATDDEQFHIFYA